ncbi:MAG: 3-oxoacyl-[Lachnospiraceae bacterium]|nr:3-oxoacyl-[acyl-carrier-protein] reductase [Lachnospiraceae bacterium]MBR5992279.1 3-oxoacyl-[acyl-carrier-protein] reductase [Lachnospiraceae bacterium]
MSVALITGGSRGIGRVIALTLAGAGYDIAFCYTSNEEAAKETATEIEKTGLKALPIKTDVSNEADVTAMVQAAKDTLGSIDVLVNNAGITRDGLLLRMSDKDISDVLNTNLKSAFYTTKAVLRDMMKNRRGKIINITSIVGITGDAGQSNYAASKAGLIGFTKSVADEYGSKGICVNAVAPGFIETEMTDKLPEEVKAAYLERIGLKRFGTPEDVANVVKFLASSDSDYITGQVIEVTGGMR